MSIYALFSLGTPEIFTVLFILILVPLPLYMAYRLGYNKGRRIGRLEEIDRQSQLR